MLVALLLWSLRSSVMPDQVVVNIHVYRKLRHVLQVASFLQLKEVLLTDPNDICSFLAQRLLLAKLERIYSVGSIISDS